jgi:signal peptidase
MDAKWKKLFCNNRWVILILSAIVLVYLTLVVVSGLFFPIQVVNSNSMFPTMVEGDLILVKSSSVGDIDVGTIVVFKPPKPYDQSLTIHRVVMKWVEEDNVFFQTKGDNNPTPDTYDVTASNIIAEYTGAKIPYLGNVILFLRSTFGIVSITIVFVIWIVYIYRKTS